MKTGNVILNPYGNMWIVTRVDEKEKNDLLIHCVSFDSENCSGAFRWKDSERTVMCHCEGDDDLCESCNGTGEHKIIDKGMKHGKILASNVKEYIKKSLLKNFEGLR